MRVLVLIAGFAVGGLIVCPVAAAKELPPEVRAMAERAFLEGRLDDLETTLAGARSDADRYPLDLATRWWRLADGHEPPFAPGWEAHARHWPLVGALRFDRWLRESAGAGALAQRDRLREYRLGLDEKDDGEAIWFLEDLFRLRKETYEDPEPLPKAERTRYGRLKSTAQLSALGALGAFVVLTFFGALIVARRRDESPRG